MAEGTEGIQFTSSLPGDATFDEPAPEAMDATEDSSLLPTDPEVDPTPSTSSLPLPAGPTPAPAASPAPPSSAAPITVATTFQNGTTRTWSLFYFHPHTPSTPLPALTDSYFSPTPSELQTAFAGQVAKREQLVDRPLLTRALREKEAGTKMEEKRKRWPETRIRIRFADRSLVECAMKSTDLLGAVYEMVKATLREDVRGKPFLLYQTPPKTEFRRADPKLKGKNLLDLEFTPAAVLYFKFEDEELNDPSKPPPLLPLVLNSAESLPLPPTFDPNAADDKGGAKPKPGGSGGKLGFGGNSGKVVPSWMRVGGKTGKK